MHDIVSRDRSALRIGSSFVAAFVCFCGGIHTLRAADPPLYTFTNPAAITINDNNTATPYPSTITVSGIPGFVADAQVRLNGLTHTFPDDLDLLLVDPTGRSIILMSDAGTGTDANGLTVTFDDHAATGLPNNGPIASKRYRPRDYDGGSIDTFPTPAPAGPYGEPWPIGTDTLYSKFWGSSGSGTWSLYIVDDQGNDSGTISGGWSLILTQLVLFGSGAITINDAAPATPYPSTISVSGMPHKVQDVKVVIGGFTHTCPGDVDMLLVAPGGQRFVPFSDAAACNPGVTSVNFILADQSIQSLPDLNGAVVPGQYLPTNNGSADAFAAPAPVGPYPAAQPAGSDSFHSAFAGIDPNGTWSLYVVDDLVGDAGSMAGWTLAITTQAEFSNFNAVTISDVSPATPYPVTINVGDIPGTLVGAYLRVNGLTHSFPLDIDLMLADPSGRGFIAQSDAGSGADVNLITYTLDDAGATPLPEATNLADGAVYTPGNYALTTDVFPLPAPQAGVASPQTFGGATFGSVYLGGDPNGAWHIYIVDDSGGDSGTIVNGLTLGVVTIFDDVFVDGFDD